MIKPNVAPKPSKPMKSESDRLLIGSMVDDCGRIMTDASRELLAQSLGVHSEALRRLRVGWCQKRCAYTWPMQDGNGNIIGIRLRDPNTGAKRSVHGSAAGLFYDPGLANIESGARVWIAEGASDTAALLSIGIDAVGIPSAKSGDDLLLELCRRILPGEIVIMADGDSAGIESARLLRSELVIVAGVRIIQPPNGIKDAREWINRGASRDDLEREASAAEVFGLEWSNGGAE
jgi:DNA primase